MSVQPPGGTPPSKPPSESQPEGNIEKLAKELKACLKNFTSQIDESRKTPHLVDSTSFLTHLAEGIQSLHTLAQKATAVED